MTAALGFAEISAYYDEMYVNENHYKEEVDRIHLSSEWARLFV